MSSTRMTSDPQAIAQDLFSESSTAQSDVGQRVVSPDGRVFRYCQAGATALVPGKLYQSAAQITNHQNLTPTAAAAVGATVVTATLGATAATLNQYGGGYMVITTTPGLGYQYLISGHAAVDSAGVITLNLADPISVALTTSSRIDLIANPYRGVILNPTAPTATPVGSAVYPVTAAYYGWLQTGGVATLLADGTITAGSLVAASDATAGAVEVAGSTVIAPIGIAITGISTTEYGGIKLLIDQ